MNITPLFKPGQIVRLKSGGPNMTILENGRSGGSYIAGWFNNNSDYSSELFEEYTLVSIKPTKALRLLKELKKK